MNVFFMSRPSPSQVRPAHTRPRPGPSPMCLNCFQPRPGQDPQYVGTCPAPARKPKFRPRPCPGPTQTVNIWPRQGPARKFQALRGPYPRAKVRKARGTLSLEKINVSTYKRDKTKINCKSIMIVSLNKNNI